LLMAWWGKGILHDADKWDVRALRGTAVLLLLAAAALGLAASVIRLDAGESLDSPGTFIGVSSVGLILAVLLAMRAWNAAKRDAHMTQCALLAAYGTLLLGPVAAIYGQVNHWQDLESIARDVRRDAAGEPLILLAPDETTRAVVDMYTRASVLTVNGPLNAAALGYASAAASSSGGVILAQLPGRSAPRNAWLARLLRADKNPLPAWAAFPGLRSVNDYALPNGRRYALLEASAH
jgi:hypothetical protein